MIKRPALLADLKPVVRALESDLRQRAEQEPEFATELKAEWQQAHQAERTAATYQTWLDGEVTQAATAWILGTVFLRFCEDNGLIELPYLAGPGERLALATERQQQFFERTPRLTDRDWITAGVDDMSAASSVAARLFDRAHNPMWRITPSHQAAKDLLAFWRTRGGDGAVVHDFTDPDWDTRFLGDLYQDLSEHARDTYALLQTPDFVEEFILDLTLDPAIDEFGLEPNPPGVRPDLPPTLRVIDPTCGSGHFLLGAFHRLNARWEQHAPAMDRWDRIRRILSGLHGVDKNPFAVSIARFRLLLAVMKATGVKRFAEARDFPLNIAVGDSLIHGRGGPGEQGELFNGTQTFTYHGEDIWNHIASFDVAGMSSYHAVVGNPPYIAVRDKQESAKYRAAYPTCSGSNSLVMPFAERFFALAVRPDEDGRKAGYIGQITSNSFAKRDSGRKLIEDFFPTIDLTHVVDTSGAYIPGHGVPTLILIGRRRWPKSAVVRTARSVHGEPGKPTIASNGIVWRAIVSQIHRVGSESNWVTVDDLDRKRYFQRHPWILDSGGLELVDEIGKSSIETIRSYTYRIGYFGDSHADDVFLLPAIARFRRQGEELLTRRFHNGQHIRDWSIIGSGMAIVPYSAQTLELLDERELSREFRKYAWPFRSDLWARINSNGKTYRDSGRRWWEWHQLPKDKSAHSWAIIYSDLTTHNHFGLEKEPAAFNRHAPMIKLRDTATDADHLALLSVLNSSVGCFWLKQMCPNRGSGADRQGARQTTVPWENFYDFTAATIQNFPLPRQFPIDLGNRLDELAQRVRAVVPSALSATSAPTRERLDSARIAYEHYRREMVALQEELDWETYKLYGLLSDQEADGLRADPTDVPELRLGERAFEIVLARRCAAGEMETQWFTRHGAAPITEIPKHWPHAYREVVQRRIAVIEKRRDIALIERPEYKRRWSTEPWDTKAAVAAWLLDRCERRDLWFAPDDTGRDQPQPLTVHQLADRLRSDADFVAVAQVYGGEDADLAEVVADIVDSQHVPYLAAFRYKDTGLRKRRQWEETWELQRQEDATGERLNIPVPPKYTSADFLKSSHWSNRGKLDVPKERFISYPLASPDGDGSLLLGWAGWDHREQAHALMTIIEDRTSRDGWESDRVVPLIAGLHEVMPWVRQWHGEVDPAFGMSPSDAYASYLEDQMHRCQVSDSDLTKWRPPASGRGRRPRAVSPDPADS